MQAFARQLYWHSFQPNFYLKVAVTKNWAPSCIMLPCDTFNKLLFLPAMLITKEWSDPKSLEYGKNILVRSSYGNFRYKIFSARGKSVEGVIQERVHTIAADGELIKLLRFPMISFRANTNDELHVDFELQQKSV